MKAALTVAADLLREASSRKWFLALGIGITTALVVLGFALRDDGREAARFRPAEVLVEPSPERVATSSGLRYWESQGARIHAGAFIVSLPIDLALDTLLLPIDIGVGIYRLLSEGSKPTSPDPPPGQT